MDITLRSSFQVTNQLSEVRESETHSVWLSSFGPLLGILLLGSWHNVSNSACQKMRLQTRMFSTAVIPDTQRNWTPCSSTTDCGASSGCGPNSTLFLDMSTIVRIVLQHRRRNWPKCTTVQRNINNMTNLLWSEGKKLRGYDKLIEQPDHINDHVIKTEPRQKEKKAKVIVREYRQKVSFPNAKSRKAKADQRYNELMRHCLKIITLMCSFRK